MAEFVWFWLVGALLVILGMVFWWSVFFRGSSRERKLNKLHEIIFRKKR